MPDIIGIDVSHHNGNVDWSAVAKAGVRFAFAKASEGLNYVDPKFSDNWQGIKSAGILRGAYHFFSPNLGAVEQSKHFLAVCDVSESDLPPVIDVETAGSSKAGLSSAVHAWIDWVSMQTGRKPCIYVGSYFADDNLDSSFSGYDLWLPHYGVVRPRKPIAWNTYRIHQYTENGMLPGVRGTFDLNRWNGSEEDLLGWGNAYRTWAVVLPNGESLVAVERANVTYLPARLWGNKLGFTDKQIAFVDGLVNIAGKEIPEDPWMRNGSAWLSVRVLCSVAGLKPSPNAVTRTITISRP